MVGIQAFPIGEAYFQGRLLLFSGGVYVFIISPQENSAILGSPSVQEERRMVGTELLRRLWPLRQLRVTKTETAVFIYLECF